MRTIQENPGNCHCVGLIVWLLAVVSASSCWAQTEEGNDPPVVPEFHIVNGQVEEKSFLMKYSVEVPYTVAVEQTYTVDVPYVEMAEQDGKTITVQKIRAETRTRSVPVQKMRTITRTQKYALTKMSFQKIGGTQISLDEIGTVLSKPTLMLKITKDTKLTDEFKAMFVGNTIVAIIPAP